MITTPDPRPEWFAAAVEQLSDRWDGLDGIADLASYAPEWDGAARCLLGIVLDSLAAVGLVVGPKPPDAPSITANPSRGFYVHHEDGSMWADNPDLPGCYATGDTFRELADAWEEAVALWESSNPADPLILSPNTPESGAS